MPAPRLPLLVTKLHAPPVQTGWVRRDRLFLRLAAANEKKCTLVTGPAGYGKSVLLSQWLEERQREASAEGLAARYGWLSLDDGDNDPVRFWSYLVAALPVGEIGDEFIELLHAPPYAGIENLLILLINAIAGIPGHFTLVLDDIQSLTQPAVLDGLQFFLEHLPANLHLIFAGRSEPALPLARLRARGQMIEMLAQELRFTRSETRLFFQQTLSLPLNEKEIALLDERTEGWAASLELIAHSLAAREDRRGFLRSLFDPFPKSPEASGGAGTARPTFPGNNRNLLDYLVEEIIGRQRAEMQDFLLRTSILARICAPLCAAVLGEESGEPRARQLLEEIERANLFLIPLNNEASTSGGCAWYRYHRLFADLLQARLRATFPDGLPELHRRAARWLARNQLPFEAFRQAEVAGNLNLAAELVNDNLPVLVEQGEITNLLAWLEALPQPFVRQHAGLCLGYAWASLYRLDFAGAEEWAQRAGRLVEASQAENADASVDEDLREDLRDFLGQITAIRATTAINFKNYPAGIELARQSLAHLDPAGRWGALRSLVFLNLGDACSALGDHSGAIQVYQDALQMPNFPTNPYVKAVIIGSLGNQYLRLGHLRQAEAVLETVFALEQDNRPLLAAGKSMVYLTRIYIEQNQFERAFEMGRRAVETCQRWHHPDHLFDALVTWAELCALRGDLAGSQSALEQARDHLRRLKAKLQAGNAQEFSSAYERSLRLFDAQCSLRAQDGPAALAWMYPTGALPAIETVARDFRQAEITGLAWLMEGRFQEVLTLAGNWMQPPGWLRRDIQALFFAALAHDGLGDAQAAHQFLNQALELAQPEGYLRLFLDGGPAARRLFQSFQNDSEMAGGLRGYAAQILRALDVPASGTPIAEPTRGQVSAREIEVLRLLAAGLTNEEIAGWLVLSTNTIKTHLKRIYEKLGAGSRIEAVNLARAQGLIQ